MLKNVWLIILCALFAFFMFRLFTGPSEDGPGSHPVDSVVEPGKRALGSMQKKVERIADEGMGKERVKPGQEPQPPPPPETPITQDSEFDDMKREIQKLDEP